ncbi:MAG: hypothetical protein ACOC53_08070 [Candidatus Saliniplasma sp.]
MTISTEMKLSFSWRIAVIVYGNPRTTVDIDLVVKLNETDIDDFAAYLQKEGFFSDPKDMKRAFENQIYFSAEEKDSLFRLDIKGVYDRREEVTLKNRKEIEFEGITIYLASPEDTIAHKLYYGSEQDIEDAESIYVRQGKKTRSRLSRREMFSTGC